MNQTTNSHGTTEAPSITSIVVLAALAGLAMFGTIWTSSGDVFDGRHLVGFLTGLVLSVVLLAQAIGRGAARARTRAEKTLPQIGTWRDPDTGEKHLTIRFDPGSGSYYASGQLAAGWYEHREFLLPDSAYAFVVLSEAERDGLVPSDDHDTRLIRAWLRLPGWAQDKPSSYTPV